MTYRRCPDPPLAHVRTLTASLIALLALAILAATAAAAAGAIGAPVAADAGEVAAGAIHDAAHAHPERHGSGRLQASTTLVVNEIDYDQPSADTAEFVEIKNVGSAAINLDSYSVELINGNGGGATVYKTINLPNESLAAGDYYVICGDATTVPNCDLDTSPDSGLVQNGAPDAVAIMLSGTVVDTVSYEGDTGSPYTEGSGSGLEDAGSGDYEGISRYPDGTDSDHNNSDLSLRCITPGEENTSDSSSCPNPAGPETATPTATTGGGTATVTATAAATETASATQAATATPDPSATPPASATAPAATETPSSTATSAPTSTPDATGTAAATSTAGATATTATTATPAPSLTPSSTSAASPTALATATQTTGAPPTSTPTALASASATPTLQPLAVQILDISATRDGLKAVVAWHTASEIKCGGFNVYREVTRKAGVTTRMPTREVSRPSSIAERTRRGLIKVNDQLIPAAGDPLSGAAYELRDTDAPLGPARYWLEDVDVSGHTAMHGPVAAPRAPIRFSRARGLVQSAPR